MKPCELPKVDENRKNPDELLTLLEKRQYHYPTEDTIPLEKLEKLRESDDVKMCLANPHVRKIIEDTLTSADRTEAISRAMTEPIFVELADACLKVVEPQDTHTESLN